MLAVVVIFGMQVDNGVFYCGIVNQPSAYAFLYLSDFLSFHTLNDEIFHHSSHIGMQVDNDVFYPWIV